MRKGLGMWTVKNQNELILSQGMSDKTKRTERVNLRMTPAEYEKLSLKSKEHNLPIAVFLRDRILELSPPVKRINDLPKIDPALIRELNGIGNNINQITRLANSQNASFGKFDIVTLYKSLDRIMEELKKIERQYTAK